MKFKTPSGYKKVIVISKDEMTKKSGSGVYKILETDKILYVSERAVQFEMEHFPVTRHDAIEDLCIRYRNEVSEKIETFGSESVWSAILRKNVNKQKFYKEASI